MAQANLERLRELYKKYGLSENQIFQSPQGWKIITRDGIDQVQASSGIKVSYELVVADVTNKTYVVKATGELDDKVIETYGESMPENTRQKYPVAMAEKRAMSRVVLKLAGFYELGIYGQDEADDFAAVKKSDRKPLVEVLE